MVCRGPLPSPQGPVPTHSKQKVRACCPDRPYRMSSPPELEAQCSFEMEVSLSQVEWPTIVRTEGLIVMVGEVTECGEVFVPDVSCQRSDGTHCQHL